MVEIQKTNICCIDLRQDCIDYLKGLGLAVFEGSFGSVFSFQWNSYSSSKYVLSDVNLPDNLHEYHVFVSDTDTAIRREYRDDEHQIRSIADPEERCLTCNRPINILDLRPYGSSLLWNFFKDKNNHKIIKIVFLGEYNSVSYTASKVGYNSSRSIGSYSNYDAWSLLYGERKSGNRVLFEDNRLSRVLYEGRLNAVHYFHTFNTPYVRIDDNQEVDPGFMSLLKNENGECVSYLYCTKSNSLYCVLPQVENKAALLKSLFENILFPHFSDFFPDIEAKRWIHNVNYELPEERTIREKIALKQEEYKNAIAALEKEAEEVGKKNEFLKYLLTGTGDQLVKAVKRYLEWLGFTNVIDKDETLEDSEIKEEDLNLNYNGQLVLLEVKGINGTSTDAECSQVNKIVLRRMKQQKTTDVHGVYVVNNQKNVEPLSRQVPPFNDNQISDAVNQDRTMIFTAQLFALFFDIENGFVTKEEARECFLKQGLANFHSRYKSLGKPYNYFKSSTVICLELNGDKIKIGDYLYYKDSLQRLVRLKVVSIEQDYNSLESVETGKTGIMVDVKVPKGVEIWLYCSEQS